MSLRLRLTFSHLAVIVVAMSMLGFLLLSFVEQYFLQAVEDSLAAQARITIQALIPGAEGAGPANTTQAAGYNTLLQNARSEVALQTQNVAVPPANQPGDSLDLTYLSDASLQLSSQLATRIRIIDLQGTVLVDSNGDRGVSLNDEPLVAQGLAGQYASRVEPAGEYDDTPAMHVVMPLLVANRPAGAVYLSQPLSDMTAVLYDLRLRVLLATGIALLFSAGAGLLLSQAIARPIGRLTQAAEAVARGELDQQVPVPGADELGRLSRTFNTMTVRLKHSRQMQTDFVANVSHELRTPLTTIKGMVESLQDGAVEDLEVRDRFLATIETETERMIRLVNDLLTLSRADSEALDLRCTALDLPALAVDCAARLAPQAAARRVTVVVAPAGPGLPLAWADPDRTAQVLVNLLSNAIQYSHPNGQVTVQAAAGEPGFVALTVRDDGPGIPAAALARLGERFYRADKARARSDGGSGLGLAIARALVAAQGGSLRIESQEGQGTAVTFTLPAQ